MQVIKFTAVSIILTLFKIQYGESTPSNINLKNSSTYCSWFTCANGNCVLPTVVCNGEDDCGDASDERDEKGNCPLCPPTYWQCTNGRCIHEVYHCDGRQHCDDLSDENDDCPPCSDSNRFQCENRLCVYWTDVCNGKDDCGDLSDETENACPCADNDTRCPTPPGFIPPGSCVPPEYMCDEEGIWDCPDGYDQQNCTSRYGFGRLTA